MTSAECRSGPSPWDRSELKRAAAKIFHDRDAVVLWLDDIPDPWERQVVVNIAQRLYGARRPYTDTGAER